MMDGEPAVLPPDAWRENAAAIVMDASGRVLLGLDSGRKAYWHFPQGGVGGSETLQQALTRELQEEVGLSPERYRIVASLGGLRYKYRKGNEKSGRWRGQQQTYFLVQCHGDTPPTDCSATDEFSALTWLPWQQLQPELFVPFKRKVVKQVLAAFLPPHVGQSLTPRRYRLEAGQLPDMSRALFAGGKEEAQLQLARLALRLRAAQKHHAARGGRLLVLIHGAEGSGRRQCLRRLAAALDPLGTHCAQADALGTPLPWNLLAHLPAEGRVSLVLHTPPACVAAPVFAELAAQEAWLTGQGVQVLRLYLCTGGIPAADAALLAAPHAARCPWYAIPSEKRWYRDLVAAELLAEALESASWVPGTSPEGKLPE